MKRYPIKYIVVLNILIIITVLTYATLVKASSFPQNGFPDAIPANINVASDSQTSIPCEGYIFASLPTDVAESYKVTYHANGGTGSRVDSGLLSGISYQVLSPAQAGISRAEYTFTGWNTIWDGSGSLYNVGTTLALSENIILYAQWSSGGGQGTETPEPTNTPEPTASPEPTNTPEPTASPEPTNTPEPTDTPESTNAPEPTASPEPTNTPERPNSLESTGSFEQPGTLRPSNPRNTLVPRDDGTYVELDENSAPLGVWSLNDNGEWVFEEYPLQKVFPQTGVSDTMPWLILGLCLSLVMTALLVWIQFRRRRIEKRANEAKKDTFGVLYSLLFLCLAGTALYGYCLIQELNTQEQGRSYYTTLSSQAKSSFKASAISDVVPLSWEDSESTGVEWAPYINFEALRETSPGIVAWIKCEGAAIDYPVVQANDNGYYLNHLPDGTRHKMGSLFLDFRNAPDFTDMNSVIYGHHMSNGDMFGELKHYKTQSFYNENSIMTLYTPERDFLIELFAGYLFDAEKETLPLYFKDFAGFEQYIAEIKQRSLFVSNVTVGADDKLVTLATCTYEFSNARFMLVGKLVEDQER